MLANTSQCDPARRVSNIDTGHTLAMLDKTRFDPQAPPSSTFWQTSGLAPPTRPRGPFPLAYRPKSRDFLPATQPGGSADADDPRSSDTTSSGVRWKIHAPLHTESGDNSLTDALIEERMEIMREGLREVYHRVRVQEVSYGGVMKRREIFARAEDGEREWKSAEATEKEEEEG